MTVSLPEPTWAQFAMVALCSVLGFGVWAVRYFGRRVDNHTAAIREGTCTIAQVCAAVDQTVLSVSDRAIKEVQEIDATFSGISGELSRYIDLLEKLKTILFEKGEWDGLTKIAQSADNIAQALESTAGGIEYVRNAIDGLGPVEIALGKGWEVLVNMHNAVVPGSVDPFLQPKTNKKDQEFEAAKKAVNQLLDAITTALPAVDVLKRELTRCYAQHGEYSKEAARAKNNWEFALAEVKENYNRLPVSVKALLAASIANTDPSPNKE